ncbi:MAG: succinylglutamate desuccinylase/aspartoacylase family protein [Polyangiaceae bacterium]|nr:succinylglutamate desuccinylase/aspartoacylase family protein [Polyangiaceae bacterium]
MQRRSVLASALGALGALLANGCPRAPLEPARASAPPPAGDKHAPVPSARGSTAAPPPPGPWRPRSEVAVTGGVHGDEPSGALVLPELEALGFATFGPCNPWGVAHHARELADGRDLNRSFARDDVPEVAAVQRFLAARRPALLLDLHEDRDAAGGYLIQHGPDDDLGRRIIRALGDEFAIDPEPSFLVVHGEDGVLRPSATVLRMVELSRFYGLAFHAWLALGITTLVVECPRGWPLAERMRWQRRVVETAHALLGPPTGAERDARAPR